MSAPKQSANKWKSLPLFGGGEKSEKMRKRMAGRFNDVEEAVSVSAATSEAKQKGSVSMSFQVQPCGDETAGARDVGSHIALACLKDDPTHERRPSLTLRLCHGGPTLRPCGV